MQDSLYEEGWRFFRIGRARKFPEKCFVGAWRSLVAHLVWDQGVASSNLAAPTI